MTENTDAPTESTAAESAAADTAAAEIATLGADQAFLDDFAGKNGDMPQRAAAGRKRSLHEIAYGPPPEAAPVLPERVADALEDQSAINQAAGEAMTPAVDASEYKFNFENQDAMDFSDLQALDAIARSTCAAIAAPPEYAAATVRAVDAALTKRGADAPPLTPDDLTEALDKMHGARAAEVTDNANAILAKMAPTEREWVQSALRRLDPATAAWLSGRLASVFKSQQPKG